MIEKLKCDECGCLGNCSCGCDPVSIIDGCTLDSFLCCPCCNMLGAKKNKARWPENNIKPDAEQIEMKL